MHPGNDLPQRLALAQRFTHATVSRKAPGARQHQVTHPSKSKHGLMLGAASHGQARDLSQPARDERSHRVMSQPQAAAYARSNGNHVLECAAQFYANEVVIHVNAKAWVAEVFLDARSE